MEIYEIDVTQTVVEDIVLQNLLEKPSYNKTVLPYLRGDHFSTLEHQTIFNNIISYESQYSTIPSKKELVLYMKNNKSIPAKVLESTLPVFKNIYASTDTIGNFKFLLDKTEEFIRLREFKKHILMAASSVQTNNNLEMNIAVEALDKALQINFDTDLGTSFDDIDDTIEHFHKVMAGLTTGISTLDTVLGGGFYKKTLNVFAAVTHGGKSLIMASIASHMLLVEKKDILFITLEMPEKEVLKRIYANVLNIDVNTFKSYSKEELKTAHTNVKANGLGDLMVKEYPTGTLSTNMLRSYVDKYYSKFKKYPEIIFVDYLTIMKANSMSENSNSYNYYKKVSEELRALAMELDIPIVTAAQLNRSGFTNGKEAGLDSVSDSLGVAQTADTFFILSRTPEMDKIGQVYIAGKKNRNSGDLSQHIIGIEWSRMRFFGLDESSLSNIPTAIGTSNSVLNTPVNMQYAQPISQIPSASTQTTSVDVQNVFGGNAVFDF